MIQLRQRGFVAAVEQAISEGVMPSGIDLEITESLVMQDIEANIQKLTEVHGLGLAILREHGERAGLDPGFTVADDRAKLAVAVTEAGSAAAPTAGLHFSPDVLGRLDVERITLHVGLDTFRPLTTDMLEEHELHGERYAVGGAAWTRIQAAERVLAVGTTTTRVLETLARGSPLEGRSDLFITPGFAFGRVDALLTNFHLPRTTLLALVMAFAGIERTKELYEVAIRERYRFYSFGDAMLVL